jgi:hypothetical protein
VYYNEELVTNSTFQTQLSQKLQRFRTCHKSKNAPFFMIFLNIPFFHMVVTDLTVPLKNVLFWPLVCLFKFFLKNKIFLPKYKSLKRCHYSESNLTDSQHYKKFSNLLATCQEFWLLLHPISNKPQKFWINLRRGKGNLLSKHLIL